MAKATAMGGDPFLRIKLTEQEWRSAYRDYMSGMSKEQIMKKYNLNSVRYKELRNHFNDSQNRENGQKQAMEKAHTLDQIKAKSGARRQGRNDICLCGSGRKYKSCCALKR